MENKNNSFVCQPDWILSAIEDCETDAERIDYLKIIYEASQGNYNYKPEFNSNKKVGRQIVAVIKRAKLKYDKKIEQTRNAGKRSAETRQNKQMTENKEDAKRTLANVNNISDSVSDSVSDNSSLSPFEKGNEGVKEVFRFIDFWIYYIEWRDHDNGCSLSWHSSDPEAVEVCQEIAKETDTLLQADLKRRYFESNAEHQKRVATDYKSWRDFWSIATAVKTPTPTFILELSQILEERRSEPKVLSGVADEIRNGKKIMNIASYIKAFQPKQK